MLLVSLVYIPQAVLRRLCYPILFTLILTTRPRLVFHLLLACSCHSDMSIMIYGVRGYLRRRHNNNSISSYFSVCVASPVNINSTSSSCTRSAAHRSYYTHYRTDYTPRVQRLAKFLGVRLSRHSFRPVSSIGRCLCCLCACLAGP